MKIESKTVRLWKTNIDKLEKIDENINQAIDKLLSQNKTASSDVTKCYTSSDLLEDIRMIVREELEKVRG